MLLSYSLVQEWLDTKNATPSIHGDSWRFQPQSTPRVAPPSSWIGFTWPSSQGCGRPCCLCTFSYHTFLSFLVHDLCISLGKHQKYAIRVLNNRSCYPNSAIKVLEQNKHNLLASNQIVFFNIGWCQEFTKERGNPQDSSVPVLWNIESFMSTLRE